MNAFADAESIYSQSMQFGGTATFRTSSTRGAGSGTGASAALAKQVAIKQSFAAFLESSLQAHSSCRKETD